MAQNNKPNKNSALKFGTPLAYLLCKDIPAKEGHSTMSNVIEVTEAAKEAIRKVKGEAAGLRVMVSAGGCAGYQYRMGLVHGPEEGDSVLVFDDVKVFVDGPSASLIQGTVLDYVESIQGSGFQFENPNAEGKCSCGKSFAA
jgi:iron-sulfur cluster assembly protein